MHLPPTTAARSLVALVLLLGGLCACGPSDPPTWIVVVTLDTARADALTPERMPALWARAAGGLVFERAYAATSSTQPSHASLFTGRHPWEHGVTRNGLVLGDEALTLAERLSAAGFATAAVVAGFPLERRFGFAQGFDDYRDAFTRAQPKHETWLEETVEDARFYSLSREVTDTALELHRAARGDRRLLWVHYWDAHAPYGDTGVDVVDVPTRATIRRDPSAVPPMVARARALYDADLRFLDGHLDRLLEQITADAAAEGAQAHVVITADHGESFGEDGSLGHGKRITSPQVHVPLVLLSPRAAPGKRVDPVGAVDVHATLLALALGDGSPAAPSTGREGSAPGSAPDAELHGRDLLAGGSGDGPVLGMRRTFAVPTDELRLDGTTVTVDGPRFYLATEAGLLLGDGDEVAPEHGWPGERGTGQPPGAGPDGDQGGDARRQAEQVRRLFAGLAVLLAGQDATELMDAETRAALEALGYTR